MWVRRKLHLHHLFDIVLGWRPVGILNDDHVGPANHSFPWLERRMLRIFIPILADPSRYPAMWTVTGLAIENRLRWVLGHVVADLGLVGAASLENFVQLSQPLCHARLLEALPSWLRLGVLLQWQTAEHSTFLSCGSSLDSRVPTGLVLPSGLMPPGTGWAGRSCVAPLHQVDVGVSAVGRSIQEVMPSASVVSKAFQPPLDQTLTRRPATGPFVVDELEAPGTGHAVAVKGRAGARGAGVKTSPMSTVPEPPITTLPCAPILPSVTAGRPLMSTVDETAEIIGLPQAEVSPCRAAGRRRKRRRESPGRWGCCHALALGRSLDR